MSSKEHYFILGVTSSREANRITRSGGSPGEVQFVYSNDLAAAIIHAKSNGDASLDRETLAQHCSLIEQLHAKLTIVPMKYGTIATQSETEYLLELRRSTLLNLIEELKDRTEVSARWIVQPEPERVPLSTQAMSGKGRFYLLDRIAAKDRTRSIENDLHTTVGRAFEVVGLKAQILCCSYRLRERLPNAEDVIVASIDATVERYEASRTEEILRSISFCNTGPAVVQSAHTPYSMIELLSVQNGANSASPNVSESKHKLQILSDSTGFQSRAFN